MKENKKNWFDNNPFFNTKHEFKEFVTSMMAAEENDNLPIALSYEQAEELTMNDIKLFSERFKKDTGLSIDFHLSTCDDCGKLHCIIEIDHSIDKEERSLR